VRSLTSGKLRWNPKHLLHLIPFCLLQAIILHFYHFQPTEHKLEIVGAILNLNQPPEVFMLMVLVFLHIFLYLGACQRLIKKYNRQIEHIYSTINLSWIKNTLRSLTFILILSLLVSVMQFMGNPLLFNISLVVLMVTLALFIGGVLFRAFEEPQLFVRLSDTKYASSRLTDNQKVAIENRIKQVLAQGKIYLNPDTTITDLADALDLSARQVSQVINQQFNQSFFELINSYRIKEAQTIIKNSKDPKMTILEVMYKVGFNSKSSFNTQFKKIIGLTPSEFKRLHQ
jgi:AraC-like DNA-binding protein